VDLGASFKSPDAGLSIDVFRQFGEACLNRLAGELTSQRLSVETLLCEATDPVAAILQAADDTSVGLLVIGTRGHQGLARLVLGSTADALIHRAKCPILTIGPGVMPLKAPLNFQSIVYATDFSVESAKACVFALSFAQDFCAHLYLCHVSPPHHQSDGMRDDELNDRFMQALRGLVPDVAKEYCEPECVLEHGVAADGILLLAKRVNADLIVLGTRRASNWFDDVKTGVAFQVVSASSCPVLTVRC
jgi:nucleotide-binding universal stress UspA family protein